MGVEGIGNNILKLRRKKGVTQEVLADFIGVTKTSVSKWETGTTMPDIQMLPLLASYFEVSVDELINYVPMLNREQIRFHYQRLAEAFAARPFQEVLAECDGMIRKYYSCYPFLQQMTVLILNHVGAADGEESRQAAVKMVLDLCGHILADCQDVGICKSAIGLKAMLNLMEGRPEQVLEELGEETIKAEYMENTGELLTMAYLMAGDFQKAEQAAQTGMYQSLMRMIDYGIFLLEVKGKKAVMQREAEEAGETEGIGETDETSEAGAKVGMEEEMAFGNEVLKRMDKILEVFQIQGLSPNAAGKYEYQAAVYLARGLAVRRSDGKAKKVGGTEEEIFRRLERYSSACRQLFADGIRLHGDSFFSLLDGWFEEMELETEAVRSRESVRESIAQSFSNPVFHVLEDQERLGRLAGRCGGNIK